MNNNFHPQLLSFPLNSSFSPNIECKVQTPELSKFSTKAAPLGSPECALSRDTDHLTTQDTKRRPGSFSVIVLAWHICFIAAREFVIRSNTELGLLLAASHCLFPGRDEELRAADAAQVIDTSFACCG